MHVKSHQGDCTHVQRSVKMAYTTSHGLTDLTSTILASSTSIRAHLFVHMSCKFQIYMREFQCYSLYTSSRPVPRPPPFRLFALAARVCCPCCFEMQLEFLTGNCFTNASQLIWKIIEIRWERAGGWQGEGGQHINCKHGNNFFLASKQTSQKFNYKHKSIFMLH